MKAKDVKAKTTDELNAELERGRRIAGGHPADKEPFVEPRRAPKTD